MLVAPTLDSWNRIEEWLHELDDLGRILGIRPAGPQSGSDAMSDPRRDSLPTGFGTAVSRGQSKANETHVTASPLQVRGEKKAAVMHQEQLGAAPPEGGHRA